MQAILKKINLKPESSKMLRWGGAVFGVFYLAAALLYLTAGYWMDYQQALIFSEHIAVGLKAGFGVMCIGFLIMECK